jgi:hypothetical protein
MKYREIEGWWEDDWLFRDIVTRAPQTAHFVEVGSWMGRSAACMAEIIKDSGKLIRFDSVDTWRGSGYGSHPQRIKTLTAEGKTLRGEYERNLRNAGLWEYVNPVVGDSVAVAEGYEAKSLDCVFIDGDHREDAVRADLQAWLPKLKPGGTICGHDWPTRDTSPQAVKRAVESVGLEVEHKGMVWWARKKLLPITPPPTVKYPASFPGVPRGWWYLWHGFNQLGCDVHLSAELEAGGIWSPPNKLPDPVHIAALSINGTRVWYDCSDFTPSHPDLGLPYFAKNALAVDCPPVIPIGQYLGTEPEQMLGNLSTLRTNSKVKTIDTLAVFSNIDERLSGPKVGLPQHRQAAEGHRNVTGLRRSVVQALQGDGIVSGLWRWSHTRPEVHEGIKTTAVSPMGHWQRIAQSRVVVCLPGVGGDSTRLRTEALAIGSAIVTVEGPQEWPGNWRGCWVEAKRDAESVVSKCSELSADAAECRRIGRLGRWYFETNLRPDRMAERMIRGCA